ncbi:MAG: tyrosine-type recombinase/integrase [Proteobacteria bacterium]|nr:tyrosine-type recombinase/integrase [Pseudomonadota bacterium]
MRLTDRTIKALKPKAERFEVWESGRTGLGLRISPAGRKSWIYMYRFDGRPRRMTLGTYPVVGLANARVKHARAKELLEKGSDPGALHIEKRRAERDAETIQNLVDEYLEKWARPRKRSADEDERILRKDVLPAWGKRKARDIRRRDVILLLDTIVERGAPIAANRTLAVIRKMFNFAISRDIVDATPVAMVRAPAKENQRDRILSAEEIRTFWNGLADTPMTPAVRLALKLELVTAQRKGELVGAALSEFDFSEGIWTIPPERVKNGIAHRVPLSPLTLKLIEEAHGIARQAEVGRAKNLPGAEPRESEWLCPSPRGNGPIEPRAVSRALRRATKPTERGEDPAINLKNVTPHDLRRTAASGMASLGVARLVIAKVLNHAETGVTAIYDRHGYDSEKRHALEAWAAHLEGILSGKPKADNVVQLAAAGETA